MATTGVITGAKNKTLWLSFEWSRTGVNVSNNTSEIEFTLKLNSDSSLNFTADKQYSLQVNGVDFSGTLTSNISWDEAVPHEHIIKSGVLTIPHENDGTKNFKVSAVLNIAVTISGTYVASLSLSDTQTLTTIPRATVPVLSASKMQMGDDLTITLNRASTAYSHKLTYSFEGKTGTIASGVTTNTKWTIPRSLAEAVPNSYHGLCVIKCETYNGTKLIGSVSSNLTLTVNSLDYPSITSVLIEDALGFDEKFEAFIQNKSKAKITVNATGVYGSTISGYEINFLGLTVFKNTLTSDVIAVSGEIAAVIKVTDSRNRSVSLTKKITVLPYTSPTISIFECARCDASGIEDIYGEYLGVKMNFMIDSLNQKNDKNYIIEYQEQGSTTWTQITSGSVYTYDGVYNHLQAILSPDSPYLIRVTVSDYFSSVSYTGELSTAFVLLDIHQSGTGVAIGKVAEEANLFDVALPTKFRESVSFLGGLDVEINDYEDDLNNALNGGMYYISKAVSNRPESAQGFMIVMRRKAGTRMQIYITLNAHIWIRTYQNATWGAWSQT